MICSIQKYLERMLTELELKEIDKDFISWF